MGLRLCEKKIHEPRGVEKRRPRLTGGESDLEGKGGPENHRPSSRRRRIIGGEKEEAEANAKLVRGSCYAPEERGGKGKESVFKGEERILSYPELLAQNRGG